MILGALGGLVGSFIPKLIGLYKEHQDHKHEMEMMQFQLQNMDRIEHMQLEEAKAFAMLNTDASPYSVQEPVYEKTGNPFLNGLQIILMTYNSTVRPTVTYLLIGFYVLIKYFMIMSIIHSGVAWTSVAKDVYTGIDSDFIGAIIAFWFGNRSMYHLHRGNL